MHKLLKQIIKFGGVGILCFLIDFGILYLLTDFFELYYLLSAAISFTVSVIVNYLLSIKFVFDTNPEYSKSRNFILFLIFSIIGLLLTELIMKFGVDFLNMNYLMVKIIATVFVMIYNFVTRKIFLE
ncbi:MAG: GtrA family protein [Lachnospiraceae bacterium]